MQNDPIQHAEEIVRGIHDTSGKYVQSVLRRYPLLFSFLIVFSVAAITDGLRLVFERIELFETHPTYLILLGVLTLFLTGMLYKVLDRMK